MPHPELLIFFFVIAFIYASVGFGGGSGYLAILALYALPFKELRLIALICNVIVVTGGTFVFIRNKQVDLKKILPFVLASVPMAYAGAIIRISQTAFFVILGFSLIVAAVFLLLQTGKLEQAKIIEEPSHRTNIAFGGAIGFLSGMVGIGGGIFLSPLLNLVKWDTPKRIAATASVFILVNSLAGIAGQLTQLPENIDTARILLLGGAVFLGGQFGSRMGAIKFSPLVIRRVTAILVFAAGLNVLIKHLPKLIW